MRVLDLTVALAGPFATLLLAGMGADVIKIERPGGSDIARLNPPYLGSRGVHFEAPEDDDVSLSILNRGRSKRSVTLDLTSPEGYELFLKLVAVSDVVVENMSHGTAARLGVDYGRLQAANPRIVFASIAGLGSEIHYPGLKVMDILAQALSGVMGATGFPDGPPTRVGVPVADLVAALYAVVGIQAALYRRAASGEGDRVTVNLVDSLLSFVLGEHFDVISRQGLPVRTGNTFARLAPFGVFQAADGHVAIAAVTDQDCARLLNAIGRPELAQDSRFASRGTRASNAGALERLVADWTKSRSVATVLRELHVEHGVPSCPVLSPQEVLEHPLTRESPATSILEHPVLRDTEEVLGNGMPIGFERATTGFERAAATLGQHNEEVLGGLLGLSSRRLDALREAKAI